MITAVPPSRWVPVAALFAVTGAAHLARPAGFDAIVPRALPGAPRTWTTASGLVELATGLAVPRTRRCAGTAAAAFLPAVWPANAQMAIDAWRAGSARRRALATAHLPLQVPLLRAPWRAGR